MITMEPNTWIIGQVIIDIIIAGLLLWFIAFHFKRQKSLQDHEAVFQRSEDILSEMDRISRTLERNLEEKKRLSHHVLSQLDGDLQKAEECRQQLQKIFQLYPTRMDNPPGVEKDANQVRASVKALLAKGFTKEEAARYLEISVGEIDLLLKLHSYKR